MTATVLQDELHFLKAFIAQLGERQTEDLEVSSSILLEGTFSLASTVSEIEFNRSLPMSSFMATSTIHL
jgi:hypothetical protein